MAHSRQIMLGLAALTLVATACGGGTGAGSGPVPGASSLPATNATTAPLLPTDAHALPDFDFGKYQDLLAQLEGTPVFVNIWASWCGPCQSEAPGLADAARTYGTQVQFVGIDIQDSRGSALAFMQRFGWSFPSVFDASGEIRDRLGFIGQPVSLFYDASGRLVSSWSGPVDADLLARRLAGILTAPSAT